MAGLVAEDNGVMLEEGGGYFDLEMAVKRRKELEAMPGPDFVDVNDRLESAELHFRAATGKSRSQDEAYLKELLKEGGGGGSWLNMLGFGFFNVAEDDDEDEDDEEESEWQRIQRELDEETAEERELRRAASLKRLQEIMISPMEERPPPPSEKGGWLDDAAWLLGVASKVLF